MVDPRSPEFEPLFLVGCPRSGTTWLQLLLAQHPRIATARETHIMSWFRGFFDRWKSESVPEWPAEMGLRGLLGDEGVLEMVRGCFGTAFARIAEKNPASTVILEKTPDHVRFSRSILRVYPRARFLHLIRDPRAVVASLRKAAQGWGREWIPEGVIGCAELWRVSVTAGLAIPERTDAVQQVRYEALHESGPEELGRIFAWLGLEADADLCDRAVAACQIDRLRAADADPERVSPFRVSDHAEGFFRRGETDSWRQELTMDEIAIVEWRAHELMAQLGYEPTIPHPEKRPPAARRWRRRRRLARRLERLAERLRRAPP